MAEEKQIVTLDFEVYGRVQGKRSMGFEHNCEFKLGLKRASHHHFAFSVSTGVFFRKYTVKAGKQFGLRGFCMNAKHGTVLGQMQGPPAAVREMRNWLSTVGSPNSKIEKAEFRNEKFVENYTLDPDFKVHH